MDEINSPGSEEKIVFTEEEINSIDVFLRSVAAQNQKTTGYYYIDFSSIQNELLLLSMCQAHYLRRSPSLKHFLSAKQKLQKKFRGSNIINTLLMFNSVDLKNSLSQT